MNKQELAKLLMATFLEEVQDHVGCLGRELLALEKPQSSEQRSESITNLFRAAHSLKGAAAVVSADPIRDACHAMEDFFSELREGRCQIDEPRISTLLKAVDATEDAARRLRAQQSLDDTPLSKIIPDLQALSAGPAEDETETETETETEHEHEHEHEHEAEHEHEHAVAPAAATDEAVRGEDDSAVADPAQLPAVPRRIAGTSVRVAAEKLDALLAHSGELLVARGRFSCRADDTQELRETAAELKKRWRESERSLRQSIRQSMQLTARDTASRLALQRSDAFLGQTGVQIAQLVSQLERLASGCEADNRHLKQICESLDDEIYNVRMLPFASACIGLDRVVRDVASFVKKEVRLDLQLAGVEVDRSVLEGLKDPLVHLVRNAVDHGVESSAQRLEQGKPAQATITISAALRGGQVEVLVADDGRGFDLERIAETARRRGLTVPTDPRELAQLVFAPGFSTAPMVTDISGRGVGLDVVQSQVESLHGSVEVSFEPGQGTRFTILVPLTLTTIRAMLVEVDQQTFAIPTPAIERVVRFPFADVKAVGGKDMLILEQTPTLLVSLGKLLGLDDSSGPTAKRLAIVLTAGEQRVAAVVDEVRSEQEVLVKSLGHRVLRLRHFSGCTVLPSGQVALVLNVTNITRTAVGMKTRYIQSAAVPVRDNSQKRILVVEDSATTRTLMKNILETAGYRVDSAVDGQEAVEKMRQQTFDLVVSDVDMPRMGGFELTEAIRAGEATAELPVVLVTARGSNEDKTRGIQVGANAYIIKGQFEQQSLLETVGQLV